MCARTHSQERLSMRSDSDRGSDALEMFARRKSTQRSQRSRTALRDPAPRGRLGIFYPALGARFADPEHGPGAAFCRKARYSVVEYALVPRTPSSPRKAVRVRLTADEAARTSRAIGLKDETPRTCVGANESGSVRELPGTRAPRPRSTPAGALPGTADAWAARTSAEHSARQVPDVLRALARRPSGGIAHACC